MLHFFRKKICNRFQDSLKRVEAYAYADFLMKKNEHVVELPFT